MNRKNWIIAGAILVIAIGVTLFVTLPKKADQAVQSTVQTTAVQKGDIAVIIKGSGSVKATHSESIYAKKQGIVKQVLVKKNDLVKKGQVLMTYEGPDVSTSMRQQLNMLKQNQDALLDKQEQYKKLVMEGAELSEIENAKLAITRSQDAITATQAEITALKKDALPLAAIVATMDGTITELHVVTGSMVTGGAAAFSIADYSDLSVTIRVDELDIPKVRLNMPVTVAMDALPNEVYSGKVTEIAHEGTITNGVSLFDVTILLAHSSDVKAGMSAQGKINVEEKHEILVLPIETVTQQEGKHFVQVYNNAGTGTSTPVEAEVTVGIQNESLIEVVSGLKEGDQVVIPTVLVSNDSKSTNSSDSFFGDDGGEGMGMGGGL